MLALVLLCSAIAQPQTKAAAPPSPAYEPGRKLLRDYLAAQVADIAAKSPPHFSSKAEWEAARPRLREDLLDMLGLSPLPPRTDLKPTITGKQDAAKYVVENLHFQSRPGLYVTANLYLPKPAPTKAPAVLYVCGHGNITKKIDGKTVSFGSKTKYARHAAWYAEHGFVCLILDTLQLGEIPGEHHGTYRLKKWYWPSWGYTPAGVECWNAMRALDYLATRPEVDMERVGVTGRSGGGAYSWWLGSTDERVKAMVPVAGIADLEAHVLKGYAGKYQEGVVSGHCDCMFMVNSHRWDFPMVASLCSPRNLLLGNSDVDDIFPVHGYRRLSQKVRAIYALEGVPERFDLMETKGPHEDTPPLRIGEYSWMKRWLKNDRSPTQDEEPETLTPEQLKVFKDLPADANNPRIDETFIDRERFPLPPDSAYADLAAIRKTLEAKVVSGWNKVPSDAAWHAGWRWSAKEGAATVEEFRFVSEKGVELPVWIVSPGNPKSAGVARLAILDDGDWESLAAAVPGSNEDLRRRAPQLKKKGAEPHYDGKLLLASGPVICFSPRGIGPTRWSIAGSPEETQNRRRFPLLGQTLEGQQLWDILQAWRTLRASGYKDLTTVVARGELANLALLAPLWEPEMKLDLDPAGAGPPELLNFRRHFDFDKLRAALAPKPPAAAGK